MMSPQYGFLSIVAIALIAGVSDAGPPKKIVGGHRANVAEFPYMALLYKNGKSNCGGVILDARHVLTAAHCVHSYSSPYNAITVETGTIKEHNGLINHVKSITIHHRYSISEDFYDIAIIVLKKNITFNANQASVVLPDGPTANGVMATTMGWGYTSSVRKQESPYLKKIDSRILSHEECLARAEGEDKDAVVKDIHICTENRFGTGICMGDSGDPLVYDGHLVGILTVFLESIKHQRGSQPGYKSCAQGYPVVYMNVSYFAPWIQETMEETYRSEGPSDALEVYKSHFQNVLIASFALEKASQLHEVNP